MSLKHPIRLRSVSQTHITEDAHTYLLALESLEQCIPVARTLQSHLISDSLRSKVIDWVIEIHYKFQSSPRTLYLTVKLIDCFMSKTHGLCPNDLHLLSLSCVYLSSKYEDLFPIQLLSVAQIIGQCAIPKEEILAKERELLSLMDFNLHIPVLYDFIAAFFSEAEEEVQQLGWLIADISLTSAQLSSVPASRLAQAIFVFCTKGNGLTREHHFIADTVKSFKRDPDRFRSIYVKHKISS